MIVSAAQLSLLGPRGWVLGAATCTALVVVFGLGWAAGRQRRRPDTSDRGLPAPDLLPGQRLVAELHDGISHDVSAILLRAAGAHALAGGADPRVSSALSEITEVSATAMHELVRQREVLAGLGIQRRPPAELSARPAHVSGPEPLGPGHIVRADQEAHLGLTTTEGAGMTRVVLADDQAMIRAGISMLLDAEDGIEVVGAAENGREAVELARRERPDLVVMDIRMPVMDGIEATRQIVQENSENEDQVKVLVLTTFDEDDAVYGALRAGASGFLLKHAAPQELPQAIRRVAEGEYWIDPKVAGKVIAALAGMTQAMGATSKALDVLTAREREVLALMANGLSNTEISEKLFLSPATVKTHVSRILLRTGSRDRAQAVVLAFRSGLVQAG